MSKYYAGIGSRSTPNDILKLMTSIAQVLDQQGYMLRSGGADGADTAFANGSNYKDILRPKDATPEAIKIAMSLHPAPQHCNSYVRKLHGRNVQIILGRQLDQPVEFVVLWTPGGKSIGGTGMGIAIAKQNSIDIYNLYVQNHVKRIKNKFNI